MRTLPEWRDALGAAVGQLNTLIRSAHGEGYVIGLQQAKITNSVAPDPTLPCPLIGISVKGPIALDDASFTGDQTHAR